jgi:hypothetical protein
VTAPPHVLLRVPVEDRCRGHGLLDTTDLQLGPIDARLLAHQLSDTLALFFLAQVSRDRLLFCQPPNILRQKDRGCALGELRRISLPRTKVNRGKNEGRGGYAPALVRATRR